MQNIYIIIELIDRIRNRYVLTFENIWNLILFDIPSLKISPRFKFFNCLSRGSIKCTLLVILSFYNRLIQYLLQAGLAKNQLFSQKVTVLLRKKYNLDETHRKTVNCSFISLLQNSCNPKRYYFFWVKKLCIVSDLLRKKRYKNWSKNCLQWYRNGASVLSFLYMKKKIRKGLTSSNER